MAIERRWKGVPATPFTANGTQFGIVTVADTAGYVVKREAVIAATTLPMLRVQIQRVLSSTQLIVGKVGTDPNPQNYINISAYTVALAANIAFPEQEKSKIRPDDIDQAVYEPDPIVAKRVIPVDEYGNFYNSDNPLPTAFDGTVSIGDVSILDPTTKVPLKVNNDGSINVIVEEAGSVSSTVNLYQEAANVAANAAQTILTYICPGTFTGSLQRISVSGENLAKYYVQVNGNTIETQRTYWGNLNTVFNFMTDSSTGGYPLVAGDTVTINVINTSPTQIAADFEARLQVIQNPLQS